MHLSGKSRRFLDRLREYLDGLETGEAAREFAHDEMEPGPASLALLARMGRDGWTGISWPVEYGGHGRPPIDQWLYLEELARRGIYGGGLTMTAIGPTLIQRGSDVQRATLLPLILVGEARFAVGYTEADAGSDLGALQARARRENGSYVVNGHKLYTTMAQLATHLWLAVRTGSRQDRSRGVSVLVVELPQPGITVRAMMTQAATRTNEVVFDDVRVPVENVVGEEGAGWDVIRTALDFERMLAVGGIGADFSRVLGACGPVAEPGAPGAPGFVASPHIRHGIPLADMAVDMELAVLLSRDVATREDPRGRRVAAAMNKVWSTELRCRLASGVLGAMGEAAQLAEGSAQAPFGGRYGHLFRIATMRRFAAGTNDVQLDIIARDGLALDGREPRPLAVLAARGGEQGEVAAAVASWLGARAGEGALRDLDRTGARIDLELWDEMSSLGWPAVTVMPPPGGGAAAAAAVLEQIGHRGLPSPFAQIAGTALALGSPRGETEISREVREAVSSGEAAVTVGAHEAEVLPTLEWRGGHGEITGGPVIAEWAVEARWLLVLVRDPRFERYALVALSGAEAGLVRAPVEVLDHQRVAAVSWDAVRCDQRQVVAGGDWRFALGVMTSLDVMRGAESVGMATRMVEMTCGYVGARRQFDRQLSTFQVVQHRCARMLVATTAAALAIREAVVGIDAGSGSFLQMLIAGRAAVRSLEEVAMEASLLHGAVGFMAEHPLARLFRRAGAAKCRAGPFSCFEEAVMAEISAVRYGGAPGALGDVYPWLIDDAKET